MIEANWSPYTYDYAWKFDSLAKSACFFNGFHMIIQVNSLNSMLNINILILKTIYTLSPISISRKNFCTFLCTVIHYLAHYIMTN